MIRVDLSIADSETGVIVELGGRLPDLWATAQFLRKMDDLVTDYAESQEANAQMAREELQK